MRNLTVAAAVAAALTSGAAMAANVDVYISGASAQKNFWYADLANIANCAAASITGNKWNGPATAPFTKAGDFSYVQCTAGASPLNSNISPGSTVTFHYSAELGSIWGVVNALGTTGVAGYPSKHLFLTSNGCAPVAFTASNAFFTTPNCGTSASPKYALYTSGQGDTGADEMVGGVVAPFVSVQPDIDVTDLEPTKFAIADNWATANNADGTYGSGLYTAIGAVPSKAALTTLQGKGKFINGEVFAVILNGVGTDFSSAVPTNLSSASLSAIFQGNYSTWNQVPEIGASDAGATPIVLIRRDHGSGSQVAASIVFTGQECGAINNGGMVEDVTNGGSAIIAGSTSAMRAIVNANAGSIGYLSLTGNLPGVNETDNYTVLSIDGVQPNAHNAAAGYYKFATQTWAYTPDASSSVAQTMLTRAATVANIAAGLGATQFPAQTSYNETVTKGADSQFTVTTTGGNVGIYGLAGNGIGGNTSNTAEMNTLSNIPTANRYYKGELCTVAAGNNGS